MPLFKGRYELASVRGKTWQRTTNGCGRSLNGWAHQKVTNQRQQFWVSKLAEPACAALKYLWCSNC